MSIHLQPFFISCVNKYNIAIILHFIQIIDLKWLRLVYSVYTNYKMMMMTMADNDNNKRTGNVLSSHRLCKKKKNYFRLQVFVIFKL